jgi:hypothetical protein
MDKAPPKDDICSALAAADAPLAGDCRSAFCDCDTARIEMWVSIPAAEAQTTYERRCRINAGRGRPIEGFDEMVEALGRAGSGRIGIGDFLGPNGDRYVMFFEEGATKLIGVLKIPPDDLYWAKARLSGC